MRYLWTESWQFNGQSIFLKQQDSSLCLSWFFCGNITPQAQVNSFIGHALEWTNWSMRFIVSLHREQIISICGECFRWSLAVTRTICRECFRWSLAVTRSNSSLHTRPFSWMVAKTLFAKIFRQNFTTNWRHITQGIGPAVCWNISPHCPQNVWPHGVATWASITGFALQGGKVNKGTVTTWSCLLLSAQDNPKQIQVMSVQF